MQPAIDSDRPSPPTLTPLARRRGVQVEIEPAVPAGFRHWRDHEPAPDRRIKAILVNRAGYLLARGTGLELRQNYPSWFPFAWQLAPPPHVLLPSWHEFPETPPEAGRMCCVMYFDLHRELGDSAGFGCYQDAWPIGTFTDRSAYPGEPDPEDPARWAPYAWRAAQAGEIDIAALSAALRHAEDTTTPLLRRAG